MRNLEYKYKPPLENNTTEDALNPEIDPEEFNKAYVIACDKIIYFIEKNNKAEKIGMETEDNLIETHQKDNVRLATFEALNACGFNNETAEDSRKRFIYRKALEKKLNANYNNIFLNSPRP